MDKETSVYIRSLHVTTAIKRPWFFLNFKLCYEHVTSHDYRAGPRSLPNKTRHFSRRIAQPIADADLTKYSRPAFLKVQNYARRARVWIGLSLHGKNSALPPTDYRSR